MRKTQRRRRRKAIPPIRRSSTGACWCFREYGKRGTLQSIACAPGRKKMLRMRNAVERSRSTGSISKLFKWPGGRC